MERRLAYILNREFDSPLGQNSMFYETFVVPPEKKVNYPPSQKYIIVHHQAVFCESGTEVFDKYEKDPIEPDYFTIYYEMVSKDTSNFFGTACRVKMGDYAREQLIKHYYSKGKTINYDGNTLDRSVTDFSSLIKVIAKDYGIDATLLKGAIYLEILDKSKINDAFTKVSSLNNLFADWLKGGIEATEKWKFTEENYDFTKYYVLPMYSNYQNKIGASGFPQQEVKYKPIIPVPFPNNQYKNMSESPHIVADGLKNLKDFVTSFDEISTAAVFNIVKATPTISDDVLFAVTYLVKNIIEDNMPESIKIIYKKLKAVFNDLLNVVSGIENFIKAELNNEIAKINAFLCGLINGFISLVQTIIMLLAMVVEKFPIFAIEKSSPLELAKHQEELEFIEDFVDLFAKNSREFFEGVKNLFSDGKIWKEISEFSDMLKKKFIQIKDLNEYFWAYFIGGVALELILDALIAYFTGGSSLVAEASAKISRLTAKAEQLGAKAINFGKGLGKKVANSAKDLYKWLEKEFLELVEAIKSGKIGEWIERKINTIFGEGNKPYDDLFDLLVHIDILKDNIRYLKCLEYVSKKSALGKWIAVELEAMIRLYTSFVYRSLNRALRGLDEMTEEFEAMKEVLNAALEKLPISKYNNSVLKRSAYFTENDLKIFFKEGSEFTDEGFFSTTHSEKYFSKWLADNPEHNVIFKVYGKNGKLIEDAAFLKEEGEILFKSGTTFDVQNANKIFDYKVGREFTEIILKEK